ncbi:MULTISPECIES: hypothetical protein [Gammaproteobacteria]|uniref:hypothetical protein n=1 Tax=Gammaproteobacteria TaxID=1236 RepID=UPI000DD09786|nr:MULTISPECIES: hypothetical protein [Gammaproteobacteria]RTE86911.1 hypothetical protein DQX04_00535 [Aliidiomarina sp. B3213]TCZ93299.1 hypothetical protein EYQ95_04765 [Lysobacter sp. N42]
MSFQERSAWAMLIILSVAFFDLAHSVYNASMHAQQVIDPSWMLLGKFVGTIIVLAIASHIILAIIQPKQAEGKLDEREKTIALFSSHISGIVLAIGLFFGLGHYMIHEDGNALFYTAFGSLVLSQIAEYVILIWKHRRG